MLFTGQWTLYTSFNSQNSRYVAPLNCIKYLMAPSVAILWIKNCFFPLNLSNVCFCRRAISFRALIHANSTQKPSQHCICQQHRTWRRRQGQSSEQQDVQFPDAGLLRKLRGTLFRKIPRKTSGTQGGIIGWWFAAWIRKTSERISECVRSISHQIVTTRDQGVYFHRRFPLFTYPVTTEGKRNQMS